MYSMNRESENLMFDSDEGHTLGRECGGRAGTAVQR